MSHNPDRCPACGFVLKQKRSRQHHNFFFACLDEAYANWPSAHRFQPASVEHLRHWLLVQAGYHNVIGQNLTEDSGDVYRMADFTARILQHTRTTGSSGFVEITGEHSIIVKFPKSISWRTLDQKAFTPIAEAIFQIVEHETGIKTEDLKKHTESA